MGDLISRLNAVRDRSHDAPLPYRIAVSTGIVVAATVVTYQIQSLSSHHFLMMYMILTSLAVLGYGMAGAVAAGLTSAVMFLLVLSFGQPEHDVTLLDWLLLLSFVMVSAATGYVASRLHASERRATEAAEHQRFVARTAMAAAEHSVSLAADGSILTTLRHFAGFDEIALFRVDVTDSGAIEEHLVSGDRPPADVDTDCLHDVARVAQTWGRDGLEHKGLSAELALSSTVQASGHGTAVYMPLLTADRVEGVLYLRSGGGHDPQQSLEARMSAVVNEIRLLAVILERQRLGREAAAAQAKVEAQSMQSVLMQSLTHELKTPLAATRALVSDWMREPEAVSAERLNRDAEVVDRSMERLETSINELLEISRLKTADWVPRTELCEVGDVLNSMMAQVPDRWRSRLKVDVDAAPLMFECDQKMLGRVLASFVTNAFVYGDEPVGIRVRRQDSSLVFEVEDHGPGLDDSEKSEAFDPFYRGRQAMKRSAGTGLGLAIAAEIAHLVNGTIEVEDVVPSGACFRFSVPLVEAIMPGAYDIGPSDERESDAG